MARIHNSWMAGTTPNMLGFPIIICRKFETELSLRIRLSSLIAELFYRPGSSSIANGLRYFRSFTSACCLAAGVNKFISYRLIFIWKYLRRR